MQYPAGWTKEERDNFLFGNGVSNVVTFFPQGGVNNPGRHNQNNYHTYVAIAIDPHPDRTLSEYLQSTIQGYESLKDFSLVDASTSGHLSGQPAYTLVYYDNGLNVPSKSLEIGTFVGSKVYYFEYQADPGVNN